MSRRPHNSALYSLPETLPIFPLAGALLLPRGQLPLNIFEPRYLAMTNDAMLGDRIIGMARPIDPREESETAPAVYKTGCAGRITSFEETTDGRYLINLTGVCRYSIIEELSLSDSGYRRVHAAYDGFADDLDEAAEASVDRARLTRTLQRCFPPDDDVQVDWTAIARAPSDSLVTSLAMILPFAPSEKQALLEARDLGERARILTALMEMMAAEEQTGTEEIIVQ
jgi:hypothetical protein